MDNLFFFNFFTIFHGFSQILSPTTIGTGVAEDVANDGESTIAEDAAKGATSWLTAGITIRRSKTSLSVWESTGTLRARTKESSLIFKKWKIPGIGIGKLLEFIFG